MRQQCHCGQSSREIECGQNIRESYNCGKQCGRLVLTNDIKDGGMANQLMHNYYKIKKGDVGMSDQQK